LRGCILEAGAMAATISILVVHRGCTMHLDLSVASDLWVGCNTPVALPGGVMMDGSDNRYYVRGNGITRWNAQINAYEHCVVHQAPDAELFIQYGP
jgi:hypothetical protein